ncbi:MAG: DNAase [Proteobacteria bacterium]|nr:MAG: DNAase [Pseudomonadota bacterium]
MMRLIDTHCHFDDVSFDPDRQDLLRFMRQIGVSDLIVPAITALAWPAVEAICATDRGLHAAYGLHPIYLAKHCENDLYLLEKRLTKGGAIAVGECGLDYFVPELTIEAQTDFFVAQLRLAKQFDLPVIIHARRSVDHVIKQIRRVGGLRGVVHSFSGSRQQAEILFQQGFLLGVGGTVTYERAQRLRRVVAQMPAEALLLETDAPDQPDAAWRGKRNDPLRLPVIAATVAELRGVTLQQLAAFTTANAQRLFGID